MTPPPAARNPSGSDADGAGVVDDGMRLRYADAPTAEVSTWIDAPTLMVWSLVADIELMPALSDELQAVEWVAPATAPAVGASFRGYNRQGGGQWSTVSSIVDYDPGRAFGWVVGNVDNPGAIWRFTLRPENGGTCLTQWVQMGPGRSGISMAIEAHPDQEYALVAGRMRNFARGMTRNLAAIKAMAEQRWNATT